MTVRTTLRVIEIDWTGPYTVEDVQEMSGANDRGVLQVYGSHPVFGADALLCIDAATEGTFAERVLRIQNWFKHTVPSAPSVYVGRLGGTESVDLAEWCALISDASRLLLFFHAPPWNSHGINHHQVTEATVVLNHGLRHRLSLEVSNLWDESAWDPDTAVWKPFEASEEAAPMNEEHVTENAAQEQKREA